MKIATFNVNGIGSRLPHLLEWLAKESPDVACLQELKAIDASSLAPRFAPPATAPSGRASARGTAWRSSRRAREPVEIRRGLPGDPDDTHSRYIEAAVNGIVVGCLYLPNGNPQPGPKFDYKLAWFERLIEHAGAPRRRAAAGRARRRLQRRAHRLRHLRPAVVAQGRAAAARKPRGATGGCSRRAGPTRSARAIRTSASTRSGTISAITGRATPGCASTTCC